MPSGRKEDLLLCGGTLLDRSHNERYSIVMSELNVDPNAVINDLLEQIKRLSADNAVLRAAVNSLQSAAAAASAQEEAAAEG